MNLAEIIEQTAAEGVILALSPWGTIEATNDPSQWTNGSRQSQ